MWMPTIFASAVQEEQRVEAPMLGAPVPVEKTSIHSRWPEVTLFGGTAL